MAKFQVVVMLVFAFAFVPLSKSVNSVNFAQHHNKFHHAMQKQFSNVLFGFPVMTAATDTTVGSSSPVQSRAAADEESPYLPAGYVYVQYSNLKSDSTCTRADMTVGIPVDTCVITDSTSYKVQIATDNCLGGAVFYYNDANCTTMHYNQSLSAMEDRCNVYDGERDVSLGDTTVTLPLYFWQVKCTAQPSKPIPIDSAVIE